MCTCMCMHVFDMCVCMCLFVYCHNMLKRSVEHQRFFLISQNHAQLTEWHPSLIRALLAKSLYTLRLSLFFTTLNLLWLFMVNIWASIQLELGLSPLKSSHCPPQSKAEEQPVRHQRVRKCHLVWVPLSWVSSVLMTVPLSLKLQKFSHLWKFWMKINISTQLHSQ